MNPFGLNSEEQDIVQSYIEGKGQEQLRPLAGWEGPVRLEEGAYRYSKYISWVRLFIDAQIDENEGGALEFSGGATGACQNFEVKREKGQWMRYEIDLAWTAEGEPVLRLRDYSAWDLVYSCVSDGIPVDEQIECIEDLAEYLEKCFTDGSF